MPKAKQKYLLIPRGYLSWTQISMWEQSKEKYERKYFYGEDVDVQSAAIDFGKRTAEAMENGEDSDPLLGLLVKALPRYEHMEYEINVPMPTNAGIVRLKAKLDTFRPLPVAFREYKTGRVPWTQHRANKHEQLLMYQTGIWLDRNVLADDIHLDWAETAETGNGVTLTGRIESFRVVIGLPDVLTYMAKIAKVAREIDAAYRVALKNAS